MNILKREAQLLKRLTSLGYPVKYLGPICFTKKEQAIDIITVRFVPWNSEIEYTELNLTWFNGGIVYQNDKMKLPLLLSFDFDKCLHIIRLWELNNNELLEVIA